MKTYQCALPQGPARHRTKLLQMLLPWLMLLLCASGSLAQPQVQSDMHFSGNWIATRFSQEEGLPQNSIEGMAFDKYGFLWVATQSGMARFDGRQFKTYNTLHPALGLSSRMQGLFTKNRDTIYALDDAFNVYIIAAGKVSYSGRYSKRNYGTLLFNTQRQVSNTPFSQLRFRDQQLSWDGTDRSCRGFLLNADSTALVFTDGIHIFNRKGLAKVIGINDLDPNDIFKAGNGFVVMDEKRQRIKLYSYDGTYTEAPFPFAGAQRWRGVENLADNGCSYICNGRCLLEVGNDNGRIIIKPVFDKFRNGSDIKFLYKKTEDYLIAASLTNGIVIYQKSPFTVPKNLVDPAPVTSRPGYNNPGYSFYAQMILPDNKNILTNFTKLISREGFKNIPPGMNDLQPQALLRDSRNTYWYSHPVGTPYEQKLCHDKMDGSPPEVYNDCNLDDVRCLYEDREGNIWVAGTFSIGYYTRSERKFVPVSLISPGDTATVKNIVQYIAEDGDGRMILATTKGIYAYDKKAPAKGLKFIALPGVNVRFVMTDPETRSIWACTYGWGLYLVSSDGKKMCRMPIDKDGNMRTVLYIFEDGRHRFWMPTNNGLYLTTREELLAYSKNPNMIPAYNRFTTANNLATNEFNGGCMPAYVRFADGTLSLPTLKGLLWFNPDSVEVRYAPYGMLPDKIMVNDVQMTAGLNGLISIQEAEARNIIFEINASSFTYDNDAAIEYSLEDNDTKRWQPLSEQNKLVIPFLKAKTYNLVFRKRTGPGGEGYTYLRYKLDVTPLWYKTLPFYAAIALLLLLLSSFGFYMRVRSVGKRNTSLQQSIAQATGQLREQNLVLKSTNEIKNKLMSLFNHDIAIPIFYMGRTLQRLALDKELNPASRSKIQHVAATAGELQVLTDDLLVWVAMNQDGETLDIKREDVHIEAVFDQKINMFTARMNEKNIRTVISIPAGLSIHTDRRIFSIILYNLLANSVKHLQEGTIAITAHTSAKNGALRIVISDIPDKEMTKMYEHNRSGTSPGNDARQQEPSHGIGLKLINDFARLLKLRITYHFGQDHQSRVMITEQQEERPQPGNSL